jgi:hypothetical protein
VILPDIVGERKTFALLELPEGIRVAIPIESDGKLDTNLVLILGRITYGFWHRFDFSER